MTSEQWAGMSGCHGTQICGRRAGVVLCSVQYYALEQPRKEEIEDRRAPRVVLESSLESPEKDKHTKMIVTWGPSGFPRILTLRRELLQRVTQVRYIIEVHRQFSLQGI